MNGPEPPMRNDDEYDDNDYMIDDETRRLERRLMGAIAAGIVVALAGVAMFVWVWAIWHRAADAESESHRANEGLTAVASALDVLRTQVEDLGEEPVVPPAKEIVEDVETGGQPVMVPGPEGDQGEQGKDGPPPSQAAVQLAVNEHCAKQPGGSCEGPQGETGAGGATGATGAAGTSVIGVSIVDCHLIFVFSDGSSTDVGNVCGPPGPQGETGATGPQGEQGEQGEPGSACADGWTQVEVEIPSVGVALICSRSI